MTLQVIGTGQTWGSIRNALNANTNELENRLQYLEVGAVMLSGSGIPASSLGNNDDYYINRSNYTLWRKAGGVWSQQVSIIGPPGMVNRGAWNSTTTYVLNDAVSYRGNFWQALRTNTNVEPTTANTLDWLLVSAGLNNTGAWATTTPYRVNDTVRYNGSTYRVITNHISTATAPDADTTNYAIMVQKGEQGIKGDPGSNTVPRGDWNTTTAYAINDLVRYNGSQWRAIAANTNVTPVEGASWTLFLEGAIAATPTQRGTAKLSVAPATAGDPIVVGDNDTRNTNARTPTAHEGSHRIGGTDALPAASATTPGLVQRASDAYIDKLASSITDRFVTPAILAAHPPIGYFRAGRNNSTAQSLAAATATVVGFDSEIIDVNGWYDPTTFRYNPKRQGAYLFSIQIFVKLGGAGYTASYVRINGGGGTSIGEYSNSPDSTPTAYQEYYLTGTIVHILNGTTDYVDVNVQNPVATTIPAGEWLTWIYGFYLGPTA